MEDMIYKEANIFFPNCALNFTAAEKYLHTENCGKDVRNGEIIMLGGHLTAAGTYLGTLELVKDMGFAKEKEAALRAGMED